jgi:hypothetical protein
MMAIERIEMVTIHVPREPADTYRTTVLTSKDAARGNRLSTGGEPS